MSQAKINGDIYYQEMKLGNAVRNTVRNMAYNLENVITNLHGIVTDLHVLVAQIDSVTNKMDSGNGFRKHENGVWSKLSNPDLHIETSSPSPKCMISKNIKHWQNHIDTYDTHEFSPDLDWSYLGLSEIHKPESTNGIFNAPSPLSDRQGCSSTRILNPNPAVDSRTETLEPSDTIQSEADADIIGMHVITVAYNGCYEKLVDDILENMSSDNADSDFSENESSIENCQSSSNDTGESSVSSTEFEAEYNRQVNPWTTFSSVINTLDSEDVFNADDILNDNYLESSYFNYRYKVNVKSALSNIYTKL